MEQSFKNVTLILLWLTLLHLWNCINFLPLISCPSNSSSTLSVSNLVKCKLGDFTLSLQVILCFSTALKINLNYFTCHTRCSRAAACQLMTFSPSSVHKLYCRNFILLIVDRMCRALSSSSFLLLCLDCSVSASL